MVLISQYEMDNLLLCGIPVTSPINRPNDGPPQYQVPIPVLQKHANVNCADDVSTSAIENNSNIMIDPHLQTINDKGSLNQ